MSELKGFEEKKGYRRIEGTQHGVLGTERVGLSKKKQKRLPSATPSNRIASSSVADRLALRLRLGYDGLRCPRSSSKK